jgi:acetylornithine deacetylase/succinyl-diaminopimelate desuccinylase-like protein
MKGQVATRAAAFAALAQSGVTPRGTVRLIAQADEEVNTGGVGMSWLVRNRPELRTDWALEEGGGRHMTLADGRQVAFFGVADKALVGLELHARGPGGHASRPLAVHNPVSALARLISALEQAPARRQLVPAAERMLRAMAGPAFAHAQEHDNIHELLVAATHAAPEMGPSLDAVTRNTFTPTGLSGSTSINVIPAHALARIDCRALPGTSSEDAAAELTELMRAGQKPGDVWEVHPIARAVGGSVSDPDDAFTDACTRALGTLGTQIELIPSMNPFYTDADHLRSVWGTTTYGFWPWRHTDPADYAEGIHASNERVLAADIEYAAQWHATLLLDLCATGSK